MIKNAAGYIRVSTAEQVQKGVSIETQTAEIEKYCQEHNMKLVDIYVDRGITARKSLHKRADLMRLMHDVESGKVNHIVVLRLDRFFRNVYDYHRMMNEYLTPNNCGWSAVKESYTTETTNGRLMINLRLSIGEQECDQDSDRIKDVFEHLVEQGRVLGGSLPFGLTSENKRVIRDPAKIHIVEDLFEKFELIQTVRGTMNYINTTYGTTFNYKAVHGILTNSLYAGFYRNNNNYCEPTISLERYNNIQKMLKKNIKVKAGAQDYIFSGLVYCAHCGCSMSGNCTRKQTKKHGEQHYRYYRCPKKTRDMACDNRYALNEENIEKYMLENIERELQDYVVKVEAELKQKKKKSNRKQIEQKQARLSELYVNGFIDMEKYKADYQALESQIIDEPDNIDRDLSSYKKFLQSDFRTIYDTLTDIEKRRLWRSVIKKILVSNKEITDIIFC
jgi:DNA invertase Pin-like site-specific DNA recombinase